MAALYCGAIGLVDRASGRFTAVMEVRMAYEKFARRCGLRKSACLPLGWLGMAAVLCLAAGFAAAPPARAQAAGEYAGATGVSAGTVTSQPRGFASGGSAKVNNSLTLAKPVGPSPDKVNRAWFAKQAGNNGAQISIDAVPPQARVWVDGKFVGQSPLTVTLSPGKHHLSLTGPRQEHADRDIDIVPGKKQQLEIHLDQTYPQAVSITVFGQKRH